jgi:hypothetical protein
MAGSNTRGGFRETKLAGGPEFNALVEANSPPRYQPVTPKTTGNPNIDPATGLPYPRG